MHSPVNNLFKAIEKSPLSNEGFQNKIWFTSFFLSVYRQGKVIIAQSKYTGIKVSKKIEVYPTSRLEIS